MASVQTPGPIALRPCRFPLAHSAGRLMQARPLRVYEIRPSLSTLGSRESSSRSTRSSSASSRPERLAATGHRKLLAVAWSADRSMRSGILPARPKSTPHRAEATREVVNGFRNQLKFLVVSKTFAQCLAVAGGRAARWNSVRPDSRPCATGRWVCLCALETMLSPSSCVRRCGTG